MWITAVAAFAFACATPVTAAPQQALAEGDCVDPCADLAVSNEATNEIVGANERFSYYLTIENDGPTSANAVTLTDTLPATVSFVSTSSDDLQCAEAARVVTCTVPVLELDAAAEVEVIVEAPDAIGTIVNEAEVSSQTPEVDTANNATSLATEVGTGADLMLFTYAEDAEPGEPVRFDVSVLNDGPQTAEGVVVTDTLPAGVDLISATSSAGTCAAPASRELSCALGTVAAFDLVEVEIVLSGISEGALTNLASVTSAAPVDPDLSSNSDRDTALIGNPAVADLIVDQDATSELMGPGERFSYYLTVENAGPASAGSVTLTDELPASVRYISAAGLPCSAAGRVVTCTTPELEAGGLAEVELVVEAPGEVRTLVNEARVRSATPDFDTSNNVASLDTGMGSGAELALEMYADPPQPGESVHFSVSVWNDGPQSARGVVVEDLLPESVDLVSAIPDTGTCSAPTGRRLNCALGTVAPFDEVAIELVVSGIAEGVLTNLAVITSNASDDPDPDDNRAAHTVVIGNPPVADLAVYNEGPPVAAPGSELVYTLWVENVGPELARAVRLTDQLPGGSTFLSITTDRGDSCSHTAGTLTCELGDLSAGEAISVEVRARATTQRGRLANIAELVATGGPSDSEPSSNVSTVKTQVGNPPTAANDAFSVDEDSPLHVAAAGVLDNDSSPDAAPMAAQLVQDVEHGVLALDPDGSFTYSSSPNFAGSDRFTYRAGDDAFVSNTATVTITVKPVNDSPTASGDRFGANQDTILSIGRPGVLANDSDVESSMLTAALVSAPANGSVTLSADGSFNYVPRAGFYGTDAFVYKANDGELDSSQATVTIDVAPAPAPELRRLTVLKRGTGTGMVMSTTAGIVCGADCTEDYAAGTSVTLVASTAKGSRFVSWGGACTGVAATCTVRLDAATEVTATFAKIVKRPKVVKRAMCFRKRTIKVPKSQVAKYKKRGAKLGPCKKPKKRG